MARIFALAHFMIERHAKATRPGLLKGEAQARRASLLLLKRHNHF